MTFLLLGIVIGYSLYRVESYLRYVAQSLNRLSKKKNDPGIVQTIQPINKPKDTDGVAHARSPRQVAIEEQRRFEARNIL